MSLCLASDEGSGKSAASAWEFYTAGLGQSRRKEKSLDLRDPQRTSKNIREPQRTSETLRDSQRTSETVRDPQRTPENLRDPQRLVVLAGCHQQPSASLATDDVAFFSF